MVSTVSTVAYLGLEARAVEVQCQIAPGMVGFTVVGLPDKAVAESRERVRSAISALGLALPPKRITINLSPADLPKEGSHYDLPIALALLGAMGLADAEALAHYVVVGELGLDGRVAASPGVLLAALHASSRDMGLICPAAQGPEAAWAGQIEVVAAPDLLALLNHLKGQALLGNARAGHCRTAVAGVGFEAGEGAGNCQACAGDCCSRRSQSCDDRPAGRGQVTACIVHARHITRTDSGRGIGGVDDRVRGRNARRRKACAHTAISVAAP